MSSAPARRLAWLLVGVLLGLASLLWLARGARPAAPPPHDAAAPGTAAGRDPTAAADPTRPAARSVTAALAPRTAQPMNRANRAIELGEDLHALATELLPAAEGGDAEAQYSLHRIVDTCAYELARFADETALARRRDELMARTGGVHGPAAAALDEERYAMCEGFRSDELARFGAAEEWLHRAAAAGHPLASVAAAVELDRATPAGEEPLTDAERLARQRALLLVGLRSGRPEALWEAFAFDAGYAVGGQWAPAPEGVAWLLLACARGLECSRAARWRRELEALGGLPPYEDWTEALLFDLPLHQREAALARARELAAALDRGDAEAVLPGALREDAP